MTGQTPFFVSQIVNSRPIILVNLAGFVSAALWATLAWITRGLPESIVQQLLALSPEFAQGFVAELRHGFWYDVDNNEMPTVAYLAIHAVLWLVFALTGWRLWRAKLAGWGSAWVVVGFAIVFRVLMLFSEPIHENDFYRYFWDGKSLINGVNPYLYEPAALWMYENDIEKPLDEPISGTHLRGRPWTEADAERLDFLASLRDENPVPFQRIGHWQVSTIYPPAAQALFAMSGDSLLRWRLILLIFDIGVIGLILLLLRQLGKNPAGVIFYAWSPLIIVEFANSAHYDVAPIAFTLLAIVCLGAGRRTSAAAGLVLGTLAKFFSGFLVPICFRPCPKNLILYAGCALAVLAPFVPFVLWQDAGFAQVFRGLSTFTNDWHNNGGIFSVIDKLATAVIPAARNSFLPAKAIAAGIFLVFIATLTFTPTPNHETLVRKCFWAMALFFVLNPTAFPWYFAWVIPFLCVFPRPSWILLMLTLQLYYLDFHDDYPVTQAKLLGLPVLNWITWGLFGMVWLAEEAARKVGRSSFAARLDNSR